MQFHCICIPFSNPQNLSLRVLKSLPLPLLHYRYIGIPFPNPQNPGLRVLKSSPLPLLHLPHQPGTSISSGLNVEYKNCDSGFFSPDEPQSTYHFTLCCDLDFLEGIVATLESICIIEFGERPQK